MSDDPVKRSPGFVEPFSRFGSGVAWGRHPAAIDREPLPVPDYVAARLPSPVHPAPSVAEMPFGEVPPPDTEATPTFEDEPIPEPAVTAPAPAPQPTAFPVPVTLPEPEPIQPTYAEPEYIEPAYTEPAYAERGQVAAAAPYEPPFEEAHPLEPEPYESEPYEPEPYEPELYEPELAADPAPPLPAPRTLAYWANEAPAVPMATPATALLHEPVPPHLAKLLRPAAAPDLLWPPAPRLDEHDDAEPVAPPVEGERLWSLDGDGDALRPERARPQRRRALATAAALVVVLLLAGGVAWRFLPGLLGARNEVNAVFNAPMMVIRAAAAGRVGTITANAGETVDPASRLLTVRPDRNGGGEQPVLAGVHGVVRSVETVPGTDVAVGSPLVRIQDCDRAFLTVPADAKLQPGDAVEIRLPNLAPIPGTVRASAGIMEPPNAKVVTLPAGALGSACPVGARATVRPAPATARLQS